MVHCYRMTWRTWKLTKKLFVHLQEMPNLNAFHIHKSRGGTITHRYFWEVFVCTSITHSYEENVTASGFFSNRPDPLTSQLSQLEVKHSQHWLSKGVQGHCHVHSLKKETWHTLSSCKKCGIGLCTVDCFEKSYTHVNW
jgi:ribosomal protein S16